MAESHEMMKPKCHDCGVEEGQYHLLGCDMERCPFCGNQLLVCDCALTELGLYDNEKYDASTDFLSPEVYEQGLTDEQQIQWLRRLEERGRFPFIEYPLVCAKCGRLWPKFFRVPDEEWQYYIQPDKQRTIICLDCYNAIKSLIDATKGPFSENVAPPRILEDLKAKINK